MKQRKPPRNGQPKSFGQSSGKAKDKSSGKPSAKGGYGNKKSGDKFKAPYGTQSQNKPQGKPKQQTPAGKANAGTARLSISLYGQHACRAAFLNPERKIKALYITENALNDFEEIINEARELGLERPRPQVVEREALDKALPREAVHQGIGLNATPLEEILLADIIRKSEVKGRSILVLLDQVSDPHNIGAILRSACAFGADGVIVQSRNAPEMSALIAKTASGAAEQIPVITETNLNRAIEQLQKAGYFAVGLDERGQQTIGELPNYEKCVLVMGAEGPGLRPLVREHCDILAKLPTSGTFSSLNVSNAAAVSLYALSYKK